MFASFIAKLNNKHFMSLAGNGTMAVLAMLTVAILYRALPMADIGYWVFFQTVAALLDTFRTGFLQVALIKFYTGTEQKRSNEVLGSVWFLAVSITAVLAGINLLLAPFIGQISDTAWLVTIQWFGLTFIATLPSSIASWVLQADQRFDRLLVLRIINQGTFLISVICLILFKQMSLQAIFMANLLANILASGFTLFAGWTHIRTIIHRTKSCIAEVFHFGKFSVGTTISANLLRSADTFIITYLLGPAAVAIYNLPGRLMEIIEIPLRSTLATAISSLAKAFNRNNRKEVSYILQKYAGTLTLAFIPLALGAFIFADLAISLLGGGKYVHTEAANLYRIMMIFAVFYPIDRFIAVSLDIIHQPKANFIKVILMLIGNVIGDFVGIYVFGNLYGAAIATVVPLLIGIFYGYYCIHKHIEFKLSGIFILGYIQVRRILRKNVFKKQRS